MGFIDTMRSQGHAVESICRVLSEQGCQIAARTYRAWKSAGRVIAARTVSDAHVVDAVRDIAWKTKTLGVGILQHRRALSATTLVRGIERLRDRHVRDQCSRFAATLAAEMPTLQEQLEKRIQGLAGRTFRQ